MNPSRGPLLVEHRSIRRPVLHEAGHVGGMLTEHWDGRVDADVFAPCVQLKLRNEEQHGSGLAVPQLRPISALYPDDLVGLSEKDRSNLLKGVGGGAFATASGFYCANMLDVFDASQSAFDFLTNAHKIAMYTNAIAAMSYYTDSLVTSAPYNANEVSGTGYTAGGYTLANKTLTQSPNGTVMFDNTVDPNWSITGSFATAARGAVIFSVTTPANWLVLAINFGADYNVTNGTFTIQFNALGIATVLFAA